MKRLLVVALLIVTSSFYSQAQQKNNKSKALERELMLLLRAEDEAEDKRDLDTLDRLLNDDFIFTTPNGALSDKKKLIDDVKNDEPEAGQTIGYDEIRTHDYVKTAVVNYLLTVKGKNKEGKDYTNRYRNTVVWVKQQGRWRMAAIHVSRIRPVA